MSLRRGREKEREKWGRGGGGGQEREGGGGRGKGEGKSERVVVLTTSNGIWTTSHSPDNCVVVMTTARPAKDTSFPAANQSEYM